MSNRARLSRLALVSALAGLIAAPAASAAPFHSQGTVTHDARGEAAADAGTGAADHAGPFNHPSFPGPPMWLENAPAAPVRAPELPDGDGGGVDLAVGLLIAGTLALGGGTAVVALKARAGTQPVH